MTNEKDREIANIIRSECFVDISQTERPCFEWDLDTAANVIGKYRDESVKAEREALDKILSKMSLLSSAIDAHDWNIVKIVWDDVMDAIESTLPTEISPDQGTDEKEAERG